MSRIAAILADHFEDVEYTRPAEAFRLHGHQVVTVGREAGSEVAGKKQGTRVLIERAAADVEVDEFDALLIPGGYSPDKLRVDEDAVAFARDFVEHGKPVFSICHGPQLLITADVLRGRTITGYASIIQDIENAGARFWDEEVVRDGNLISSRHPGDLPAFVDAALEALRGGAPAST